MSEKTREANLKDIERRATDVARLSEEPDNFFVDPTAEADIEDLLVRQMLHSIKDGDLYEKHRLDGHSQTELAKRLGISPQAVSKRLAQVEKKLRESPWLKDASSFFSLAVPTSPPG